MNVVSYMPLSLAGAMVPMIDISVSAGFPNPCEDYLEKKNNEKINLNINKIKWKTIKKTLFIFTIM